MQKPGAGDHRFDDFRRRITVFLMVYHKILSSSIKYFFTVFFIITPITDYCNSLEEVYRAFI